MLPVLVAMLIASGPIPDPPCCKATNSFSNTETSHRIGHVITTAVVTTSVFGAARYLGASRKQARWIAVGASLTAVLAKELYDYHSAAHNFSVGDVVLGSAGTAAGILIAEKIHWPEDPAPAHLNRGKK